MLNKKHKLLELKTSKLISSLFVWNYKTNFKWKWIEFADFREYSYWDDIKNIDFVKSENQWKTIIKLYEEERELSIYFVIELNESFKNTYLTDKTKEDLLYEVIYLLWLSGLKSWDKVWSFYTINWDKKFHIAKKWKQNFINIVNWINNFLDIEKKDIFQKIKWLLFNKNDDKKINTIKYFNNLKIKDSLVIYITDSITFNTKDLKVLTTKNDLIFCNIFNDFENTLEWDEILKENNTWINIDLTDKDKINHYLKERNDWINTLRKNIIKFWWKYLYLNEKKDIYKEFFKLFKK